MLLWRLRHSETRVVVTDPQGAQALANHRAERPDLRDIIVVGDDATDVNGSFWDVVNPSPIGCEPADTRANDPALLIYTSSTTGDPKGVLHGHRVALGQRSVVRQQLS